MKKILIALDYNPSAEKIAETGFALAQAMGAEVILIHVLAEPSYYSTLDFSPIMGYTGFSSPDMLMLVDDTEIRKASEAFLAQSKMHLGDERIVTLIGEGDCADAILKASSELNVDIIVMGTHSRSGFDKILMGSISQKVLNHAEIPVLVIPTKNLDNKVV